MLNSQFRILIRRKSEQSHRATDRARGFELPSAGTGRHT